MKKLLALLLCSTALLSTIACQTDTSQDTQTTANHVTDAPEKEAEP